MGVAFPKLTCPREPLGLVFRGAQSGKRWLGVAPAVQNCGSKLQPVPWPVVSLSARLPFPFPDLGSLHCETEGKLTQTRLAAPRSGSVRQQTRPSGPVFVLGERLGQLGPPQ